MKENTIERIRKFTEDRDWDQFHSPVNLAKSIVIEAAELLACFSQFTEDVMVINEECKKCQIKRNINKYPVNATEEKITEYQYKVNEIVKNSDGLSTPQVAEKNG